MNSSFFQPFVGSNYHIGINGKRILVLGASFYCPKTECPFFRSCTNTTIKDSSPYDRICPEYSANGICLHDEPTNSIENWYPTYQIFEGRRDRYPGPLFRVDEPVPYDLLFFIRMAVLKLNQNNYSNS